MAYSDEKTTTWAEAISNRPRIAELRSYDVTIFPDWSVMKLPLGGYLSALLSNAVRHHCSRHLPQPDQLDSITSHIAFLSRSSFGPATIQVEVLKSGSQFSNIRARLLQTQGGRETICVEGMYVQGNLQRERESGGISAPTENSILPRDIWEREICPEIVDPLAASSLDSASTKLRRLMPPGTTYEGSLAHLNYGPSVGDEWLAWSERSGETLFDIRAIPLLMDCSRPPARELGDIEIGRHWMSTLSITVEIKKGPPNGSTGWKWLFLRTELRNSNFGRYDLDLTLFDEIGDVVAKGRRGELKLGGERRGAGAREKSSAQGPVESPSDSSNL